MKIKPALFFTVFLFSCGNKPDTDSFLQQPPFDKLTDSIQHNPSNAALYYRRGTLLFENNAVADAEKDLKKAWELKPGEEYALSIVTLSIKKNTDSAIAFIQSALTVLPQSVALQVALARGYQQKGELQQALAACDQVIASYPGQIDALLLKTDLLKALDKNPEALATLEKAYSFAPFDAELSQKLAFEYAEAKNPRALTLSDSLLKADSLERHAEPYYFKGVYYENLGKNDEALKLFNEAIQHDYNFLDAHMEKGSLLFHQKKYTEAMQAFRLSLTITPTYAEGYYWIARCQEAMNNKAEAKLNYQRAYSLDKTLTEANEAAERLGKGK